jgi:hypothetical protein
MRPRPGVAQPADRAVLPRDAKPASCRRVAEDGHRRMEHRSHPHPPHRSRPSATACHRLCDVTHIRCSGTLYPRDGDQTEGYETYPSKETTSVGCGASYWLRFSLSLFWRSVYAASRSERDIVVLDRDRRELYREGPNNDITVRAPWTASSARSMRLAPTSSCECATLS